MSEFRVSHLVERAVERMAELGGGVLTGPVPAPARPDTFASPAPAKSPPSTTSPAADGPGSTHRDSTYQGSAGGGATSAKSAIPAFVSMAALEKAGMAVTGARRTRIAEEWRVTAGQLLRNLRAIRPVLPGQDVSGQTLPGRGSVQGNPGQNHPGQGGGGFAPNLLMVTSSKANEGKSFSALNLAGSLTLGGLAEVLLLDVDSKPGALSQLLGLADQPGLFDLVADPAIRPEDLVLSTAIAGLTILPIGRAAAGGPGSAERTVTRPVVAMVEKLARRFAARVVILDSAPCLATSDASALAPTVAQIAMVVEAERTQRDDVESALELLRPCPHITLVLNKVRLVTTHAFGDYHYYDG